MKTIGLIGGMIWESTLDYYRTINEGSKNEYIKIINSLALNGAEGIILGCTEIPLLIKQEDVSIPIFDTTTIHSISAVEFALAN